jgi:glutamate---cysteine ligase / carboxylate-amine ligase
VTPPNDSYFAEVEERYANGEDFTIGIEEEYQILDPATLALTEGFEELRAAAPRELDVRGELLTSEIEITTEKCATFEEAERRLRARRAGIFALARRHGYMLGATATHPFSPWQEQKIIDTPHYRLVEGGLKYVAWRNNTWSVHVHVGIRGADRAVRLCDALRTYLPHLLALSANSPFIEDVWTQLHSARCQTFVKMFPRCGIPDIFGSWAEHRRFVDELLTTHCIVDFTQVWWSIRPHHKFGTIEIRICDAQTEPWQALAVAALCYSLTAALAHDLDEGRPLPLLATRYCEENLWRAIRYGLDGALVDWPSADGAPREVPAADAVRALVEKAAPQAERLGCLSELQDVERLLREGNGAQRQTRAHTGGLAIADVYAETVARANALATNGGEE